jgi:hypothetical protein
VPDVISSEDQAKPAEAAQPVPADAVAQDAAAGEKAPARAAGGEAPAESR